MRNIVAFFNNRSQAMQFASELKKLGVRCKTINTPREISVSCGISVIFNEDSIRYAKFLLSKRKFTAFIRFYREIINGSFKKYMPM